MELHRLFIYIFNIFREVLTAGKKNSPEKDKNTRWQWRGLKNSESTREQQVAFKSLSFSTERKEEQGYLSLRIFSCFSLSSWQNLTSDSSKPLAQIHTSASGVQEMSRVLRYTVMCALITFLYTCYTLTAFFNIFFYFPLRLFQ